LLASKNSIARILPLKDEDGAESLEKPIPSFPHGSNGKLVTLSVVLIVFGRVPYVLYVPLNRVDILEAWPMKGAGAYTEQTLTKLATAC